MPTFSQAIFCTISRAARGVRTEHQPKPRNSKASLMPYTARYSTQIQQHRDIFLHNLRPGYLAVRAWAGNHCDGRAANGHCDFTHFPAAYLNICIFFAAKADKLNGIQCQWCNAIWFRTQGFKSSTVWLSKVFINLWRPNFQGIKTSLELISTSVSRLLDMVVAP